MVFYLKYRPQKISDLDSDLVREKLKEVISGKNLPHAFLFTGPKGLGKTSAARILAKVLNCTNRKANEFEPCNKCSQCKSITDGINLDVMEIDGASNRGIDEIRDLREKIKLSPISSFKKVYIIDEAHMLTTEAFNALLKTLEEPPEHAVFIFCTTEPHKIPGTIASRCFKVEFKQANDAELSRSLERIAKGEKLNAEKEALLSIASLADGSFRDAAKIFEEIAVSAKGKKITKELVESVYKIASIDKKIEDLINYLSKKDIKNSIILIDRLEEEGVPAKFFLEELIGHLHKILLVKLNIEKNDINTDLSIQNIKELFSLFSTSYQEIKYSVSPFLPLEIAVIQWCESKALVPEELSEISKTEPQVIKSAEKKSPEHDSILIELIEKLKPINYSVAGVLRACKIEVTKDKIIIETPYKFHKERLEDIKTKALLATALKEITKKDLKLEIVLK